ncbi:multiple epidermal growth factor-like domains protein 10 [Liolophura sinensis]|uniref:multiple epidermal growth factor-like domains protein 10 n=1 Tax=Liolophura sinensis TaxID=3198878 RepID=UPI003158105B
MTVTVVQVWTVILRQAVVETVLTDGMGRLARGVSCDGGEYGPDCGQRCGYCAEGRTVCDRTTGECPDRSPIPRCQAGYQGRKCDEKCTAGTYGADCKQPCGQCAGGSDKCDRVDGWCPSTETPRCAPGWTGNKCKTECLPGRYGGGCREYCGNCRGGRDKCDKVNGACPDEGGVKCADGYDGNLCKTECLPGHYGGDCREQCGNCRGGKDKCDTVNGVCPYVGGVRCADGYLGDQCKTECDDGYYGSNCAEECGNCVDGSGSCHHTDGSCQGCAAGWKGTVCKTNCSSYRWGPDCEETCGQCHDGAVCDLVSGECPTGDPRCDTGHIGLRCTPLVIDYTGVIIGSVMSVIVAAAIITALVLVVRRRQSGSPDGTESSARNTGVTYEVPIPEVPNAGHDSDTVTYYNMAVEEEGHYETVTEKEYDKIRFSLLETDKDTNYTNLSSTVYPNTRVSSTKQ